MATYKFPHCDKPTEKYYPSLYFPPHWGVSQLIMSVFQPGTIFFYVVFAAEAAKEHVYPSNILDSKKKLKLTTN